MHRRRRWRSLSWIPAGLLSLGVASAPRLAGAQASPGEYSKNCPKDGERQGKLMPGKFDGSFDAKLFMKGDDKALGMELTLWFHGKLHVEAGDDGLAAQGTVAEAEYWLGGAGKKEKGQLDVMGGMSFTGQGTMRFQGAKSEEFEVGGPLEVGGGVIVGIENREGSQDGVAKHGGTSSGEARVKFQVASAGCSGAQGTFTSAVLTDSQREFASKGFAVTPSGAGWSVGTSSDSKEEDRFRKELERAPSKIVKRLATEVARLWGLSEQARGKPQPMDECLLAVWRGHVRRKLTDWLAENTKLLKAYRASVPRRCDPLAPNGCSAGDTSGLLERVRSVIEVDRALAMLGLDTCDEKVHTRAWDAIESKMRERLDYLLRVGAAPEDLLAFSRNAQLVGAVSPELMSETLMAVTRYAEQQAEIYYAAFRRARSAKGQDDCDPGAREAARVALAAARQCQMLGGACARAMTPEEAVALDEGCKAAKNRSRSSPGGGVQ